jgi:type IV pilus assembly protein PilM
MFRISNNNVQAIGLDLGSDSVRMIQLSFAGGKISVAAADECELAIAPEASEEQRREIVVDTIKKMIAREGFSGKEVITCLSNDKLKIKSLRLDTTDPEQIEQQLKNEVAQRFELDAEEDEIRYMIAGNVYQGDEIKNEIIFFGMDRESIADHLSLIEEAGLIPIAIDAIPCALFRSFQVSLRRQEDQELVSVLVDVGSLYTTVIIGRGQEIIFVKQIPIAGEQLNCEVAAKLGVDISEAIQLRSKLKSNNADSIDPVTRQAVIDAMSKAIEELAKEISLCFRYYAVTFRGQRPTEVVFAGGEADETTLLHALKRHLGVEITIARPFRGFDLSQANFKRRGNKEMSEWAVAVGLSMKGMDMLVSGGANHERD